jgi:transcriptional regulator with GAF, ATPase, and Fis domain
VRADPAPEETIGALSVDRAAPRDINVLDKEIGFLEFIVKIIASHVFRFMMSEENERLKKLVEQKPALDTIIGNSDTMKDLKMQIRQVADSRTTVLITGETGTARNWWPGKSQK